MKINDTKSNNSYVNRHAINDICKKEKNAMSVYKSMIERDYTRTSQLYLTSASSVSSYIFIDGPVVVRWNWRLDKYKITELFKYPYYFLGVFFSYFDYFNDAKFLSVELNFTGLFKVVTPKLYSERKGRYLIPTRDSYVVSNITNNKINISNLKKVYVDNINLYKQERTGDLLPNSCLPVTKDKYGNITTDEDYWFFSERELKRVIKSLFPKSMSNFIDIKPNYFIDNGYVVDKIKIKDVNIETANIKVSKEECILLMILYCLYEMYFDTKTKKSKSMSSFCKLPLSKYPYFKGKGISENSVLKRIENAKLVASKRYRVTNDKIDTRTSNSLNIINACMIENTINIIDTKYSSIELLSNHLLKSNSQLKEIGLDQTSLLKKIKRIMTYLIY